MSKVLMKAPTFGWLLQLEWNVHNLWIGVYWRNTASRLDIWMCLLPCLVLHYASPTEEG